MKHRSLSAILLFLLLLFGAYFGYREWSDPLLLDFGPTEEAVEQEPAPETGEAGPEPARPVSGEPPEADTASQAEPEVTPEVVESVRESVEQQFDETYILLTRVMQRHLESAEQNLEEQFSEQEQQIESVNSIIAEAIDGYREESERSGGEISDIFALISAMENEATEIEGTLENARNGWSELFEEVTAITSLSSERLDAGNYDFQTYPVGSSETLSEVVSHLQEKHDLPASDLTYLLNRFNEIEYRLVSPGGRRPPYRVVANESLRVPIPKTAGDLLGERGLPEKLDKQIANIETLSRRNETIRADLQEQVDKLREVEGSLEAIRGLTGTLEEIDLETGSGLEDRVPREALSEDLREAWEAFDQASLTYRNAEDSESLRIARESLESAIRGLLEAYESRYLEEGMESGGDPLEEYLRFIEKFSPEE